MATARWVKPRLPARPSTASAESAIRIVRSLMLDVLSMDVEYVGVPLHP